MARLKIPTRILKPVTRLANLEESLNSLLLLIERGEWDKISDFSSHLLPALEAVREPDLRAENTPQYPEQIRHTLMLLQAAIEQCSERKAQITPLINALIPTKDLPENP